jgi:release factor glutamine methyltransferase
VPSARELLDRARERLRAAGVEQPGREAALLLHTLLGMSEAALLAHDREPVDAGIAARFAERVERRLSGMPAAYLIGEREFFGRAFAVDERVLIPRPESEQLVEIALQLPLPERARVLDLGCGSGCLAVTLALERPRWRLVASDLSPAALAVARRNVRRHGVASRVALAAADLAAPLRLEAFDLVVSNPPYVADEDRLGAAAAVARHEPHGALFAAEGGLATYRRLLGELAALRAGAWLACEHGAGQRRSIAALAERAGGWRLHAAHDDLAGHERDLVWQRMR